MSVGVGQATAVRGDPRFKEASDHLQAGEWEEAIRCLEGLAGQYPDSSAIKNWLDEARLKSRLDTTTRARPKRWIIPWRKIVSGLVGVVAIVGLGFVAVRVVRTQFWPVWLEEKEERDRASMLERANQCLAAGDNACAEPLYQEILAAVPDQEEAIMGMAQIIEEREIESLCDEALDLLNDEDYESAAATLWEIVARAPDPDYCDARERLVIVERKRDLDAPWEQAEALREEGRVTDAIAVYELIKEIDANFKRETIVSRLVELYTGLGKALIEAVPPSPDALPQAIYFFNQALSHDPNAIEPATERELAQLFEEGNKAFTESRWDDAIARLQELHDRRPGYLGNAGVSVLYYARMERAKQYEAARDLYGAYEHCRQGAELPVDDTSEARDCMAEMNLRWTPTATPIPTATPTPTSTPEPTPTRGFPTAVPGPLSIRSPYVWYHERHEVGGHWEGYLGIFYEGGAAPLRFAIEGGEPQGSNYIFIRWQKCRPVPITLHVWSNDGQEVHKRVQLPGWCP